MNIRRTAAFALALASVLCGCSGVAREGHRVKELTKSVARNQKSTLDGVLYTDSLFTDDGDSRLAPSYEK